MEQTTPIEELINSESESVSTNFSLIKSNDCFEDEIDPFASEIENEHEKEYVESTNKAKEFVEAISETNISIDKDSINNVTFNVKIPFMWEIKSKNIQVNLNFPFTIEKVLDQLKIDLLSAFDSQGTFDFRIKGRIYFNGELLKFYNDDGILNLKLQLKLEVPQRDEATKNEILLIHDLLKVNTESETKEISLENDIGDDFNEQIAFKDQALPIITLIKDEFVTKNLNSVVNKKSFMSRFRNLWTSKDQLPLSNQNITIQSTIVSTCLEDMKIDESTGLPEFIEDVLNYLRGNDGKIKIIQEGLFRLSGTFSKIQILQDRLNNTGERLKDFKLGPEDCHNVTSLFKQFLRNLPEPLLSFDHYEGWQGLRCWTACPKVGIRIARFLINKLPELNKRVLVALVKFLRELLEDKEALLVTRMNAGNYGTVIGPNLLWNPKEDRSSRDNSTLGLSLQSSTLASQIFTFILQNYEIIMGTNSDWNKNDERVVAYGRVLYDFDFDFQESDDEENSINIDSTNTLNNNLTRPNEQENLISAPFLIENQIIFITGIDVFVDGWWRGFVHSNTENNFESARFPSNYVKVLGQCDDSEFLD